MYYAKLSNSTSMYYVKLWNSTSMYYAKLWNSTSMYYAKLWNGTSMYTYGKRCMSADTNCCLLVMESSETLEYMHTYFALETDMLYLTMAYHTYFLRI